MDYSGIYEAYQQIYEVEIVPLTAAQAAKLNSTSHIKSPEYKEALRKLTQSLQNLETPETTPTTTKPRKPTTKLSNVKIANIGTGGIRPDDAVYHESVSYLLDAGYADNYESAEQIISAMSEEWFNDIVEAGRIHSASI